MSEQTPEFDMMATQSLSVNGSVHASGEAYVTIERLHSKHDKPPIAVSGSIHGAGNCEVDVEETLSRNNNLPDEADDARGFTSMVSGDFRHEAPTVEIERVAIIPDKPEVMVGLYNGGFTVYDEIRLYGSVHSPGAIEVHIEDLYVY